MTPEEFKEIIVELFPFDVSIDDSNFKVTYIDEQRGIDAKFTLSLDDLNKTFNKLDSVKTIDETTIRYDDTYEFMTSNHSRFMMPRNFDLHRSGFSKEDTSNQIFYNYNFPSDIYLFNLLRQLKKAGLLKQVRPPVLVIKAANMVDKYSDENKLIPFIKHLLSIHTVQVTSTKNRTNSEFEELGYALLFQLGYNLNEPLVRIRGFDEFLQPQRITRVRRARIDKIDPPRRKYIRDIVNHYQMGLSTDNPMSQFLSYYHVIEYFFVFVYNKDLIERIKYQITQPSFSYSRDADISKLISTVTKRVQLRNDEYALNEKEALRLALKNFVKDLDKIRDEIKSYDPTLLDYYKTTEVPFSKGNKIDFENGDAEVVYKAMAHRIYKSRNAIVHSKEMSIEKNKEIYIPFKHDKALIKEIPLIRFLSEEVIINSSTPITND